MHNNNNNNNSDPQLASSSPSPSPSSSSSPTSKLTSKLLSNDVEFVQQLRNFLLEFVYPLAHEDWFPKHDYQELFGTFEGIFKFHLKLCSKLQMAATTTPVLDDAGGAIGECMLSMVKSTKKEEKCIQTNGLLLFFID
jgi:hypothetical protein